jgi:hypothetical protein
MGGLPIEADMDASFCFMINGQGLPADKQRVFWHKMARFITAVGESRGNNMNNGGVGGRIPVQDTPGVISLAGVTSGVPPSALSDSNNRVSFSRARVLCTNAGTSRTVN